MVEQSDSICLAIDPVDHIRAHFLEFLFALSMVVRAVIYYAFPETLANTAVGHAIKPADLVWNLLYFVGGTLVMVGLWFDHRMIRGNVQGLRIEVVGLTFAVTAALTEAIAIASDIGFAPGRHLTLGVIIFGYGHRIVMVGAPLRDHVPVSVRARRRHGRV
jgi:hypothetical protein